MKVIGLTGGIGSGKSTAAQFLKALGADVIDLDKVGHEVLKKGGGAYKLVVSKFGKAILATDGEIDRGRLGKIVFNDRSQLKRLNEIMHPLIDKAIEKKVQECRHNNVKVVVLEAAAMLEAGRTRQADELWVTVAPETTVLKRIKRRSGYTNEEVKRRIQSQISNEERTAKAAVVIDTDCTLDELKEKVAAEWEKLQERL